MRPENCRENSLHPLENFSHARLVYLPRALHFPLSSPLFLFFFFALFSTGAKHLIHSRCRLFISAVDLLPICDLTARRNKSRINERHLPLACSIQLNAFAHAVIFFSLTRGKHSVEKFAVVETRVSVSQSLRLCRFRPAGRGECIREHGGIMSLQRHRRIEFPLARERE